MGGRLPLLSPADLTPDQAAVYKSYMSNEVPWAQTAGFRSTTHDGRLIGPFNPNLYSPRVGMGFISFARALDTSSSLTPRVRQVVILSVAALWRAEYELYAHEAVAGQAGLSQEQISILVSGGLPDDLSEAETVAHHCATNLTRAHRLEDTLYARAEQAFTKSGMVDLVYLVGHYLAVSVLLNTFEIPSPERSESGE